MTLRGWWRRRKFALTSRPSELPQQPDEVLDGKMQSSAQGAAEQDVQSRAYDEYLFNEDNLEQMPFERMVDDQLALTRIRLFDRARRSVLREHQKLITIKSDVDQIRHRQAIVDRNIDAKEIHLGDERAILEGEKPGRAELMWPGNPPQQTSLLNAWMRLMLPYLVFVIVGAVDLYIIRDSFTNVFESEESAWIYTLPAIGVQIVFPHFIGDRINLFVRGFKNKKLILGEIVLLSVVWVIFIAMLAALRVNFLGDALQNDVLYILVTAGFVCTILGLGLWVLLTAVRHNPHENAYARLNFSIGRMRRKSNKLEQKALAAEAGIPAIQEALNVAEKGFRDAIDSAPVELSESVKSVYRRALINLMGDVDFTAAYLGVAHPRAKKSRAEKFAARLRDRDERNKRHEDRDLDEDRRTSRDNFDDTTDEDHPS